MTKYVYFFNEIITEKDLKIHPNIEHEFITGIFAKRILLSPFSKIRDFKTEMPLHTFFPMLNSYKLSNRNYITF